MADQADPGTLGGTTSRQAGSLADRPGSPQATDHSGSDYLVSGPAADGQAAPGAEVGSTFHTATATPGTHPTFHGRPVSWVAVSLIIAGFLTGGLALVFATIWWLFWLSIGIVVFGGLIALATNIFEDWY